MGDYPAYPAYKDSGVGWLGDVPAHWEVKRLKFSVALVNDKVDASASDLEYMGLEHIESWTGRRIDDETASSDGTAAKFQPGDVLFGKLRPYLAKVFLVDQNGIATTEALILRSGQDVVPRYLHYYMVSADFINVVDASTYGAKMPRASWDFIGDLPLTTPPLAEQQAIARFLDHKTAQIDTLIAKKEALLAKLAEKRTALITHAATKGLDPAAPLRDSGIDWLGEIPAHWEILALRYACEFLNRKRVPLSSEERGQMSEREYPYYGASGVIDFVEDYIFDEPTVLIAEDGANLLSRSTPLAFIADGKYWVNNHAHILKPLKGPFEYWSNLLCTIEYDPWITGAAQPKLTKENLGSVLLPLPPVEEQVNIARFLAHKAVQINSQAEKARHAIAALREYRAALITHAVTGKIDVRGVPLPTSRS